MKKNPKRRSVTSKRRGSSKKKQAPPRTAKQYSERSFKFQDLWDRVVAVVSKLRSEGVSLAKVSREVGVSPRTVVRYAGSAVRKDLKGRYQATKRDQLLRVLMVPTIEGPREIGVRDSRQATILAEYWNAAHRYLATGDTSKIVEFQGKHITDADGKRVDLLTTLKELDRLGSAGVLRFESLYARTA
jgi:hypothetical protein